MGNLKVPDRLTPTLHLPVTASPLDEGIANIIHGLSNLLEFDDSFIEAILFRETDTVLQDI
jgi:hypothetical protein